MTEYTRKVMLSGNSRESLIELKKNIKDGAMLDEQDIKFLISLLQASDPKSRKNVAQILGTIKAQAAEKPLLAAFERETIEYVKSAYLLALKNINIDQVRSQLNEIRMSLSSQKVTDDNKKHFDEQMSAFNDLLGSNIGKHTFSGANQNVEILLTTPAKLSDITYDAMYTTSKRALNNGVTARISELSEVTGIRTYKDLLFLVPNMKKVSMDPYEAASAIAAGDLKAFLNSRHKEKDPWGYRLNLFSSMDEKKKSNFIKRFTGELYRLSDGFFVDSPSDYELEIRMLENKEGTLTVLIGLSTIKDKRFEYRKNVVSQSIRPELAASLVNLAANYLESNVAVLDPFCGVGTMLIERYRYRKTSPMYGIDTFGDAIDKARENTKIADVEINYINRNYFDFKHDYQFDEIITNMPFSLREEDKKEMEEIHRKFFEYSRKILKRGAVVMIYTRYIEAARTYSNKYGYYTEKEFPISAKDNSYFCIYTR